MRPDGIDPYPVVANSIRTIHSTRSWKRQFRHNNGGDLTPVVLPLNDALTAYS